LDGGDVMDSLKLAFAELLREVLSGSKAHWHHILDLDNVSSSIKATFPSLSMFLSLEKDVIHEVFVGLKIASKRIVKGTSRVIMNHSGLDNFMTYHHLDAEITSFEIMKKKHLFICLGYWDESHPKKKPIYLWKEACHENKYDVPKVNIGTPLMHFAEAVGEFISNSHSFSNAANTNASAAFFDSASSYVSDSEISANMDQDEEQINIDIPAKDDFPLLNHFKIPIANDAMRDKLLQEIVKFNGGE
jgi:hypothetical protein